MESSQFSESTKVELSFPGPLREGSKGTGVRRMQEWLSLNGTGTVIDGAFGSATTKALSNFQAARGITTSGFVDRPTWDALIAPMTDALKDGTASSVVQRVKELATQHLQAKAREVGGDNCGPWVRMYTGGHEGTPWRWCGGFVSFILKQATLELKGAMPIPGSLSCDSLAAQARNAKRFRESRELASAESWSELGAAFIFLVRRTDTDWSHTGLGFNGSQESFATIEGNTNDDGSANGYEVAARVRSAKDKDFITIY